MAGRFFSWRSLSEELLYSQSSTSSLSAPRRSGKNDSDFRRVVILISWSRRLIKSYHVAVIAVIVVFAVLHWRKRISLGRKSGKTKDKADVEAAEAGPQSSSTIVESSSPASSEEDGLDKTAEQTPLLDTLIVQPKPSRAACFRAWLMYQPIRPLPVINTPLPSNATTLLIVLFYALLVFYALFGLTLLTTSPHDLFIASDRLGLLFMAKLPLLYLLAAKNQPLTHLTGYSYESLNILHRRLAEVLCLLALLHAVGMTGVWYLLLRPAGFTLARFLLSKIILLGIFAFVCYETLYLTSLRSFRARRYELFLTVHIILQTAALPLLFFHAPSSRPYVLVSLLIFSIDRLYLRLYRRSLTLHSSETQLEVLPDGDTVLLTCTVPLTRHSPPYTKSHGLLHGWHPTDHVFLTIPSISRLQSHPFTIFSVPPPSNEEHPLPKLHELRLLIRAQDGFSRHLLTQALTARTPPRGVVLDGPYGSPHTRLMLAGKKITVLVAGGSGIAVVLPVFLSLSSSTRTRHDGRNRRTLLVWVVHRLAHLEWVGEQLRPYQQDGDRESGVEVRCFVTERDGRPDVAGVVEAWLQQETVGAGETTTGRKGVGESKTGRKGVGIVVSGPDGLNRDVRNAAAAMVRRGVEDVDVAVEKFGW